MIIQYELVRYTKAETNTIDMILKLNLIVIHRFNWYVNRYTDRCDLTSQE